MRFQKSPMGARYVQVGRVMGVKSGAFFVLSCQNGMGDMKFSKLYRYGETVKIPAGIRKRLTKEERELVAEIRAYVRKHRPKEART